MKDFFQNDQYTEFYTENGEVWVFGDTPDNITEETPHQFVDRDNHWGDGTEVAGTLPVTDGHGRREWVEGKIYIGEKYEIAGTTAEKKISEFYNCNM